MEVSTILICTFIVLVGLQLCLFEAPNGQFEADLVESFWTDNPFLKLFYGLCSLLGVIFVLGFMGYLIFKVHWWYIGVYTVGLLLAKFAAIILKIMLMPVYKLANSMYREVVVQRVVGMIIIIAGMVLYRVI